MIHPGLVSLLSVCITSALFTGVQDPPTTAPSPEVSIDDFTWLAGYWRGEGLGGVCEEIWSQPLAGTMMGSFRLVVDDQVSFYEIMVLGPDAEGMALKVKHFSKDFVSWEDKEGSVRFALESAEPDAATFSALTMNREGDRLDLRIRIRYSDGTTRWEPITLRRFPLARPR